MEDGQKSKSNEDRELYTHFGFIRGIEHLYVTVEVEGSDYFTPGNTIFVKEDAIKKLNERQYQNCIRSLRSLQEEYDDVS